MEVNGMPKVVELDEEDVESFKNVVRLGVDCFVWVK